LIVRSSTTVDSQISGRELAILLAKRTLVGLPSCGSTFDTCLDGECLISLWREAELGIGKQAAVPAVAELRTHQCRWL
jgi:hypothetical protein